jgi:hypothetical protein
LGVEQRAGQHDVVGALLHRHLHVSVLERGARHDGAAQRPIDAGHHEATERHGAEHGIAAFVDRHAALGILGLVHALDLGVLVARFLGVRREAHARFAEEGRVDRLALGVEHVHGHGAARWELQQDLGWRGRSVHEHRRALATRHARDELDLGRCAPVGELLDVAVLEPTGTVRLAHLPTHRPIAILALAEHRRPGRWLAAGVDDEHVQRAIDAQGDHERFGGVLAQVALTPELILHRGDVRLRCNLAQWHAATAVGVGGQ